MNFEREDMTEMAMPMELNRPLPRSVSLTSEGVWRASSAVVLLLIGFGWALLILVGFVHQKQQYAELAQQGIRTTATIERIDNSGVYYSFTCNGVSMSGRSGIPGRLRSELHESNPLLILYLPSNPRVSRAAD